jgi:hypothetical protein
MPLSEKRLTANRANALKSTGPKTPGGKRNSSRNALKHGILARTVLIDNESRQRFYELLSSFTSEFQPASPDEWAMVETMAVARWRLLRLWAVEAASIIHEQRLQTGADSANIIDPPTRAMLAMRSLTDRSRHADALSRYEVRYDRQYHRAAQRLIRLRAEKNASHERSHQSIESRDVTS